MSQDKTKSPEQYDPCYEEDEIDLLDLLLVIARRKNFIIKTTVTFALIAVIYSLVATPSYRAETKLIPPQGSGGGTMAALASMGVPDFASGMLGVKTPSDLLVAIVKSPPVLDQVIDKFNLINRETPANPISEAFSDGIEKVTSYVKTGILKQPETKDKEGPTRAKVRRSLSDATTAAADTKSGIITISVSDTSADLAADMANAYTKSLQDIMQKLSLSQSSQQRLFLEEQVKEEQLLLLKAEQNLSDYQRETGILNVGAQTTAVMESLAQLRGQMTAKEVELQSASKFATKNNPQVRKLQAELSSLTRQLKQMEASTGKTMPSEISLKDLPDAGLDYLRLMRDLKFHETLYGMLIKQYESARISEAQEPSIVQVLFAAEPPEERFKPKRKLIVVLATVLGFFISIFGAFIKEFASNAAEDPERAEKMKELKARFRLFK